MRKDSIQEGAYQKALELYFSEGGFHAAGEDPEDVPVLAPQTSKLAKEDKPFYKGTAFYNGTPVGSKNAYNFSEESGTPEYDAINAELQRVMDQVEAMGGRLRAARQRGNFQEEHRIVQERNDLLKVQSALIARLRVNDLGRAEREMNTAYMYGDEDERFSEFVGAIEANDAKIARLEEMLLEFAEGKNLKSPGGDSAADPGQSYDRADDEEDDEEEDEEELGD